MMPVFGRVKISLVGRKTRVVRLLKAIAKVAMVLKTQPHLHLLADKPDNRIIEYAFRARAELLVTGDKHLLHLKRFQNVSIIKWTEFLKMVQSN